MAKKLRGKELREQRENAKLQKINVYKEKEKARQKEIEENANAINNSAKSKNTVEITDDNKNLIKKSKAKAAGLKSTFIISDDRLLMTSFGRGNVANPDKYISAEEILNATDKPCLDVKNGKKAFTVSGRLIENATVDNPLDSSKKHGQDQILCKDQLEKMYFGKTFEDNIHIQLVYKILDIEKIIAGHVNNIVYALDNILREDKEEHDDFIGYLGDRFTYEDFKKKSLYDAFEKLINSKQIGYFGKVFVPEDANGKPLKEADLDAFKEKCYHLLVILGTVRHATSHGEEVYRKKMFDVNELIKKMPAGKTLNQLYEERISEINKGFLNTSATDLKILFHLYKAETQDEKNALAKEFYCFTVRKEYKNLGFSIKRVRENIELIEPNLKDEKYNTFRRKLNRLLDFVITKYYLVNPEKIDRMNDTLRACITKSDIEKEMIYNNEAKVVWTHIKETVNHLLRYMNEEVFKDLAKESMNMEGNSLGDVQISSDATSFSQLIYLLTLFLDGKEINDLLTQLISIMENIGSFVEIMKAENLDCTFEDAYSLFEQSMEIAGELRVINSFARMVDSNQSAKKIMYIEAAELLGYEDASEQDLESYIDTIVDKEKMRIVNGKKDTNFRNFIANNVIESSRFQYLVRYGNPKKLRKLADNRKVVSFVLKGIPDDQIKAYYNSCNGSMSAYNDTMRSDLADKITALSFKDFDGVKQKVVEGSKDATEKEKKKNIVRLYLTVLYLLVKNLVYVNTRYFIAFHSADRDAKVFYEDEKYAPSDQYLNEKTSWYSFAKDFVENKSNNERAKNYLAVNFANADAWSCTAFRNCVEHLSAIRNADKYINDISAFDSYFELYHYLIQRSLIDQYEFDCKCASRKHENNPEKYPYAMVMSEERMNPKMLQYFEMVEKHKSYCKDMVKALNTPFAYNLARYKNLSIKELFDRNDYNAKKAKENDKKEELNE